jgi:putative redox protein
MDLAGSGTVDDLVQAADQLRREGRPPALLIGHSLGGTAALAAAQRIPEVRAVVTIGAPPPMPALHDGPANRAAPLLIVHIPDDETAENNRAHPVAAGSLASVITLAGADHQLRRPEDAQWVADLIDSWSSRFLPGTSDREISAEPGTVVVSSAGQGRYAQNVDTARHRWRADEPESVGGSGSGPDPYQLLLSALGACTAITLRMYADRAGIPLEDATITLTHDRLHAQDCAECATKNGRVDRIVREIHFDGPLTDAQRSRLLEIADRCPVERTLRSEIIIETDEV